MSRKPKTTEMFQNELNEKQPDKYTIVGSYVNAHTKVKIRYNACGHENMVLPVNLQAGFGCPICRNEHRVSHDEFVIKLNDKFPSMFEVIGLYKNVHAPIDIKYNQCGHVVNVTPLQIMQGLKCPVCNELLSADNASRKLYELYGDEYELLSNYVNLDTSVKLRHSVCGNVFEKSPITIFKGKHDICPYCNKYARSKVMVGVNDIHTVRPDLEKYLLNSDDAFLYAYSSNEKIWWKCPDCGYEFQMTLSNVFIKGFHCKQCGLTNSYGERFIIALFTLLGINYKHQYSPDWAGNSYYDFYFNHNDMDYIVEVDGYFHFHDNLMSGQTAEQSMVIDLAKEEMAKNHGHNVIRINYDYGGNDKTEHIINSLLSSELSSMFDLSSVDFEKVDMLASKSILMAVVNLWNSLNENRSSYAIKAELGLGDNKVRELLYKASKLGLISDTKEDIKRINYIHGMNMKGISPKRVMCNETGEIFESRSSADKKYHACLTNYFNKDNVHYSGTLPDGTRLTWTQL